MSASELLSSLIDASEKAANIARVCRKNEELFKLLIQEKGSEEKNNRFVHDFKTLADVLIQETIRYDISKKFPVMLSNIKGEESNKFENILGECVTIVIAEDPSATTRMLMKVAFNFLLFFLMHYDNFQVLDGNEIAAEALTNEIHKDVLMNEDIPVIQAQVSLENIGIWIDPIDATSQYIEAAEESTPFANIEKSGLHCVTVLIGVFDKRTGCPIIGIINQPFYEIIEYEYKSKIFWGIAFNDNNHSNVESSSITDKIAIISSTEQNEVLVDAGYKTVASAGAGYKILKVIEGHARIYFLGKGTTFKWDTCSGHAILKSLGGDIIDLKKSVSNQKPIYLTYKEEEDNCNSNGLIAYRNIDDIMPILYKLM